MELQFTTVFRRVREGYMGFVEELPAANTQVIVAADVEDRAGIDAMTSAAPEGRIGNVGRAAVESFDLRGLSLRSSSILRRRSLKRASLRISSYTGRTSMESSGLT